MDEQPEVVSFTDSYEEHEGEGERYDLFLEEREEEIRRKHKPYFKPSGLDYTLTEDRQKYSMGLEKDMYTAKSFLEKPDETPNKIILFDHLASVIDKLVTEQPPNAGEVFEEYCRTLRKSKFHPRTDHLQDMYIPPQFTESEKVLRLLKSVQHIPVTREYIEANDTRDGMKPMELMESLNYFETVGIGFSQLETFCIRIKLLNLAKKKVFKTYRLWGKIMGIYNDYIIAETEQYPADIQRMQEEAETKERIKMEEDRIKQEREEKIAREMEEENGDNAIKKKEAERASAALKGIEQEENEVDEEEHSEPPPKPPPEFPPIPESTFQKPLEVPPDKRGEGSNIKVYYVYSELDDEWIQLPHVTPQQIQVARKIRKLFTGDLNAEVNTYPPFPGNEINYLRAQIARISATTQVSPKGYFKFEGGRGGDGEEDAEEEEEKEAEGEEENEGGRRKGPVTVNPNYRPKLMKKLMKLENWVHHQEAILKQGRCTFWVPEKEGRGEGEEEEEEEEKEGEEEETTTGKEKAPPLFRPLTKDVCPFAEKLWTIQASSTLTPEVAFAFLRSEIWPGYYAFCTGCNYDGIYIGWGLKYSPKNYSVSALPVIQTEYVVGPEVMEISDPTWAQEEAWRIAHEPKVREKKLGGEGEEEEEEDEEEEEGDTDDSADNDE